jgi:acylglycerol lipase
MPVCSKFIASFIAFSFIAAQSLVPLNAATVLPSTSPAAHLSHKEVIGKDVPISVWSDPTSIPWAVMLCIHGLGLHNQSYAAFGKRMAALGVPTYAIDVRGFGNWMQAEGNDRVDFTAALNDVHNVLESLNRAHPDLPIIILGESMGGGIALQATALDQKLVHGCIASVPAGDRFGEKSTGLKVAVKYVKNRNKEMDIGKSIVNRATTDAALAEKWEDDPLSRLNLTPKELLQFQQFMNQNVARTKQITDVPVLFVQGYSDRLVKPEGTMELFRVCGSKDKDMVMIGSKEHLIFEEGQFDQHVIDIVSSWIDKHAARLQAQQEVVHPDTITDEDIKRGQGHLLLAQGYLKLDEPIDARDNLMQVIDLVHGTKLAQDAVGLMYALPSNIIAPRTGSDTRAIAKDWQFTPLEEALKNPKPTVISFCAKWVDACKPVDEELKHVLAAYGDKVNFVVVDADDPHNDPLIRRYGIGPLPAVLYLNAKNEVIAYTLGDSGEEAIAKNIAIIMK